MASVGRAAPDHDRAADGRHVRRPAGRRPAHRGDRLRRLLPVRPLPDDGRRRLPGPTDAWITLAGLARETSRIRLGTLVTAATFRLPGPLAISVAQVDQMSGGRVELGIGAAGSRPSTPPTASRSRRRRAVRPLRGAARGHHRALGHAAGETFDFEGEHYRLSAAPGAAQAGPGRRDPDHRGRQGTSGRPPRGPLRRRVQRAVRPGRGGQRPAVRRGPRGLRGGRPRSGVHGLQLGAGGLRRQGRGGVRPARRGDRPERDAGVAGTPAEAAPSARYAEAGTPAEALDILGRSTPGRSGRTAA